MNKKILQYMHRCPCGETDPEKFIGKSKTMCVECKREKSEKKYKYDDNATYTCGCGETELLNFYPTNKVRCKQCIINRASGRYANDSEESRLEYIRKNRDRINQKLLSYRVSSAKHRALRMDIEFDITVSDIEKMLDKQEGKCFYTGFEMDIRNEKAEPRVANRKTISIDRIDSEGGYTVDNIVLVCAIVNSMKSSMTQEEFLNIIHAIGDTHKKDGIQK